ncbi:MAG: PilW family protein [Marinobacter sp.]|uniref:PilW family protein n=1 Tax=Marinobacter sp. TaxID=50741 RepID=UPI00299E6473|nr:PilW family protein [Marinobacter sp.]MDX1634636.1 PilW family protein [Marinobacter sp.]
MRKVSISRQRGLSLIEFMIAGLIGLILTVGLVQIFVSNRQAFDTTAASANVQETARIGTEIISKAVRNADYWGCVDNANVFNNLDDTGAGYDADILGFGSGLEGADNNADGTDAIVDGTDSITVRGTRGSAGITIDSPMPTSSANLDVTSASLISEGDIVVLTNCQGGDIFQVTKLPPGGDKIQHNGGNSVSPGNGKNASGCGTANCLSQIYDVGASVLLPYTETYFVGTGASGGPALFMRTGVLSGASVGGVQTVELIDGVENMQILYGEDTNGDGAANAYRTAAAVADMEDVVSVRVSLLIRSSQERVLDSAQALTFNGTAVDGSDLRLRRVYTLTSTIRNRM